MYIYILFLIFKETTINDDELKSNGVDDDYSILSTDGKMSKSEIKIARQSQRKRYRIQIIKMFFFLQC